MRRKDLLSKSLSTLFNSWGSDTPPEAYWAGNELLEWIELEFGVQLNIRFDEETQNYDAVIEVIDDLM